MTKPSTNENRIRAARIAKSLGQKELAARVGVSESTISRAETGGRRASLQLIVKIANALDCAPEVLLPAPSNVTLSPHQNITAIKGVLRLVPILSWVQAGKFGGGEPVDLIDADETIQIISENTALFALRVKGESMSLEAPAGSIIIINPNDRTPEDQRLYVVRNGDFETTFKQYRDSDGPIRLEPRSHDPKFATIYPSGEMTVIGRVVQIIREL